MIGDFLARLAVALPLVCALMFTLLLAVKKGWIALPGFVRHGVRAPSPPSRWRLPRRPSPGSTAAAEGLHILSVHAIAPAARVAVLRFHGRDHLLAVNGPSLLLIASEAHAADPQPAGPPLPATERRA